MAKTPYYTKAETEAKLRSLNLDPNFYGVGVYGVEWTNGIAAPEVTRIGDMAAHQSLPVQSKMRRYLRADDGTINYFLDKDNSNLRDDGTAATLDGTHGQVMDLLPVHWGKFSDLLPINRGLISLTPFPGAHIIIPMHVSAYKASLQRTGNKLASVVNTTADFRGGNNSATNDATAATLLGKPASSISRPNFEQYAQNRGSLWYNMQYSVRRTLWWFITIEFATRNHQTAVNATLTAEGYRQGALGTGPTDLSGGDWSTFNGYNPLFNCGLTNLLGNNSGEVAVILQDFPTVGLTKAIQVNSYRGVENFFGDLWDWTSGVNVKNEGGVSRAYVATGTKSSDANYLGYRSAGLLPTANGYTTEILMGEDGDILPKNVSGGSSTTYFADYYYQNAATDALRGLIFGGNAADGSSAGSASAHAGSAPSSSAATVGSRLCFLA